MVARISFGASGGWERLQNAHFEVLSDDPMTGLRAIRSAERARTALLAATGSEDSGPARVRIFVFRSDAEFRSYRPLPDENIAGFYHHAGHRDYIAVRASAPDLERVVFHEYTHAFLRRRGARIPPWFNEGAAEFFSTAALAANNARIGNPIPAHLGLLAKARWGDWRDLIRADHSLLFYAQSWAMVHMLYMDPRYSPNLNRWLTLLVNGEDYDSAFEQAYGRTPDAVWSDLRNYIKRPGLPARVIRMESAGQFEKPSSGSAPDAGLELAEFLASLGRVDDARQKLRGLAMENPRSAGVAVAQGDLAMRQGDVDEALTAFSRAIALGPADARIYFQRALLERERSGERAILDLRKALDLDPGLGEARRLLEALLARGERTNAPIIVSNRGDNAGGYSLQKGKLIEFDCRGPGLFLILLEGGLRRAFRVDDAGVSVGDGSDSMELACGALPGRDVRLEYRPVPCGEGCAGLATKIRFE